jgi:hypothetical protein
VLGAVGAGWELYALANFEERKLERRLVAGWELGGAGRGLGAGYTLANFEERKLRGWRWAAGTLEKSRAGSWWLGRAGSWWMAGLGASTPRCQL